MDAGSPHEGVPPALGDVGGLQAEEAAGRQTPPRMTCFPSPDDDDDVFRAASFSESSTLVRENTSFETKKRNPAGSRQACPLEVP